MTLKLCDTLGNRNLPYHRLTVYTAATGSDDNIRDMKVVPGVDYVAFVDRPQKSNTWKIKESYDKFRSARRNSRAPKILCHHFIKSDYSIWIDARIVLRIGAIDMVNIWLSNADIAVFRHPFRSCIYEEAKECARRKLDSSELIDEQVQNYSQDGYRAAQGLAECSILLRRHTPQVEMFNAVWWGEHCRYSVRDQISFMYAAKKTAINLNIIPNAIRELFFDIEPRGARPEPL